MYPVCHNEINMWRPITSDLLIESDLSGLVSEPVIVDVMRSNNVLIRVLPLRKCELVNKIESSHDIEWQTSNALARPSNAECNLIPA